MCARSSEPDLLKVCIGGRAGAMATSSNFHLVRIRLSGRYFTGFDVSSSCLVPANLMGTLGNAGNGISMCGAVLTSNRLKCV